MRTTSLDEPPEPQLLLPHLQDRSVLCSLRKIDPDEDLARFPQLHKVDHVLGQTDRSADQGPKLWPSELGQHQSEVGERFRCEQCRWHMRDDIGDEERGKLEERLSDGRFLEVHQVEEDVEQLVTSAE